MSKITNDGLTPAVWHRMLYSCIHMATVDIKGLKTFFLLEYHSSYSALGALATMRYTNLRFTYLLTYLHHHHHHHHRGDQLQRVVMTSVWLTTTSRDAVVNPSTHLLSRVNRQPFPTGLTSCYVHIIYLSLSVNPYADASCQRIHSVSSIRWVAPS